MIDNIIYGLKDPRTDEFKYVGKSTKGIKRAKSHLIHSHNPLVNEWVNELKSDNYLPDIIILEHVSEWTELVDKEKYWVGKLENDGCDLLNVLILDSYNDTIKSYNALLNEQIRKKNEDLEIINKSLDEKINKALMLFGDEKSVGKLIKQRRKVLKVTQQQLSEISGVGSATLKRIELGKGNITINNLMKILDVLGLELFINLKK